MKITSIIYKTALSVYNSLPFKKQLSQLVRASGIPREKFYKDMKFFGEFTVPVNNGSFKLFHHNSNIENEIFWNGLGNSWEDDTVWILAELAKTSNVIFDIGANTGVYSLLTKTINPAAKVYAFEPVQRTFKRLQKNMEINAYEIKAEQLALSNKSGKQIFYDTNIIHQQSSSLSADKLKNTTWNTAEIVEYEIETITLDDYIEQNGITGIDLMKIDVEMHEPQVIEGFQKHLKQFCPYIVIEVLEDSVAKQLDKYFANPSFKLFHLDGKDTLVEKTNFEVVTNKWNYLVCTPEQVARVSKFIRS